VKTVYREDCDLRTSTILHWKSHARSWPWRSQGPPIVETHEQHHFPDTIAHNSFKWPGEAHANNFQHGMQCCLRPLLSRMSPVSHRLISHPSITSKRHARDSNVAFAFKHLTHVEEPRGESALSNNPASQLCSAATRDRSGSQSSCETGASKKSS
jgi:hypothetical protein